LALAAEKQLTYVSAAAAAQPHSYSLSLLALMEAEYPSAELVCAASGNTVPGELAKLVAQKPSVGLSVILKTSENAEKLKAAAPFTAEYRIPQSGAMYYLCRDKTCFEPANSLEKLGDALTELI